MYLLTKEGGQENKTTLIQDETRDGESEEEDKNIGCVSLMKKDCSRKTLCIIAAVILVPLTIFILVLMGKDKMLEVITSYIAWFKLHPYQGFIYYILLYYIWFPLMLPPIVLVLTAGWTFA